MPSSAHRAAALRRLLVSFLPAMRQGLRWLAAITWSGAFLILFIRFWRTERLAWKVQPESRRIG